MENSPDELTLLDPDRSVPVTGVEHHQTALAVYTPDPDSAGTEVEVELCFAPLTRGPQAGREGVEVRLDGWRVGELSARMSDRYGPVLVDVLDRGGRPGCLATISVTDAGTLDMQAQLPEAAGAGAVVTRPAPVPTASVLSRFRPALIGAGVVGVLLVVGLMLNNRAAELDAAGSAQPTVRAVPPTTTAPTLPATSSAVPTSAAPTAPSALGEAPAPAPAPRRSAPAPAGPASEAPPPPASPAPPAGPTSAAPGTTSSAPTSTRSGGGLGGLFGGNSSTPATTPASATPAAGTGG